MGKRELLIISAFVVAGILAYQVTAPPPTGGRSSFSLSSFIASVRREVRGNRSTGAVTTRGTIAVTDAVTDTRLSGMADVRVIGETRADVAWELIIESNGPDETTARENASRTTLAEDRLGPVLALRTRGPRNGRHVARLFLMVPSRLQVRVEGASGSAKLDIAGVAGVQLDAVVGDVRISGISGTLAGAHRNGELTVTDVGSVGLTLLQSQTTLDRVRGAVTLAARNGRTRIAGSRGPIELDVTNQELTVAAPAGTVRIGGSGGKILVDDPAAAVHLDVRRANVDVRLTRAVAVTALTTESPLRLRLDGPPAIVLDAVAVDGGEIDAKAFGLRPETSDQETRLRHAFGDATVPVALRNRRAAIVIDRTK